MLMVTRVPTTPPAARVTRFDDRLHRLVGDLFSRMYLDGWPGLSAPQVGVDAQVIVFDIDGHQGCLVNPIVEKVAKHRLSHDVCPCGRGRHRSRRPSWIALTGNDTDGNATIVTATGAGARELHHLIEHLAGRAHRGRLLGHHR